VRLAIADIIPLVAYVEQFVVVRIEKDMQLLARR
jgi:hypothetical protein